MGKYSSVREHMEAALADLEVEGKGNDPATVQLRGYLSRVDAFAAEIAAQELD